ncbi:hypothetical protein BDR06DRAFT_959918 [Suillus hirtellus]|nr:hypothetical protein BDR06DRAFT_959918 [Suillus hirtellus]
MLQLCELAPFFQLKALDIDLIRQRAMNANTLSIILQYALLSLSLLTSLTGTDLHHPFADCNSERSTPRHTDKLHPQSIPFIAPFTLRKHSH